MSYNIDRIIDANMNRLKEGLRVSEEVSRFILDDRSGSAALKKIRHELDAVFSAMPGYPGSFLARRDAQADVGRRIHAGELKRKSARDVFFANMQRAKESVRVLEEFSKLKYPGSVLRFKRIRYRLYTLEARIGGKL